MHTPCIVVPKGLLSGQLAVGFALQTTLGNPIHATNAHQRSIPGLTSKNTPLVFLEELKAFQGVSRWTLNITSDGTPILSIEELASAFLPPNLQALADLRQVL